MIKTVNLTANQELAVELHGGCHCCIENRGEGTIHASKSAGVTADADGVTAISGGNSKILRNVAWYEKSGDVYDYYGKVYLLSGSDGKAEIQTADDLNFFKSGSKGGGGDSVSGSLGNLKIAYGESDIEFKGGGVSQGTVINYKDAGFTQTPIVVATQFDTGSNCTCTVKISYKHKDHATIRGQYCTTDGTTGLSATLKVNWIAIGT